MDPACVCKEHDHKGHQDRYGIHVNGSTKRNGDAGDLVGYPHLFFHTLFT